ncbi:MAG: ABC transporter permease, partial [Bacteroidota bacterium]
MFLKMRLWHIIGRLSVASRLSLWILFALGLLSVMAPWVSPDSTPEANRQDVRIRTLKPAQSVDFLIESRSSGKLRSSEESQTSVESRSSVESRLSQSRIPLSWYEPNQSGFRYVVWDQPYDTLSVSPSAGHSISIESQTFWFGTDLMGRDLLSRLLLGMRSTLKIGVFAVLVSLLVGISIGMLAGYFGGKVDQILTWLMQVVWSVPSIMLVIAFSLALGRGAWQVYLAVGLTLWVDVARLVRGEARRLREQEFVQAAQVLGYSSIR